MPRVHCAGTKPALFKSHGVSGGSRLSGADVRRRRCGRLWAVRPIAWLRAPIPRTSRCLLPKRVFWWRRCRPCRQAAAKNQGFSSAKIRSNAATRNALTDAVGGLGWAGRCCKGALTCQDGSARVQTLQVFVAPWQPPQESPEKPCRPEQLPWGKPHASACCACMDTPRVEASSAAGWAAGGKR